MSEVSIATGMLVYNSGDGIVYLRTPTDAVPISVSSDWLGAFDSDGEANAFAATLSIAIRPGTRYWDKVQNKARVWYSGGWRDYAEDVASIVMPAVSIAEEARDQAVAATRPLSALAALAAADYRPVDFVLAAGDSHQVQSGYGLFGAFMKTLAARYGLYASQFARPGQPASATYNPVNGGGVFSGGAATTGAPSELEALMYPMLGSANAYAYVADGSTATAASNEMAIGLLAATGVDVSASWRCDYHLGTFESGSGAGTMTLAARLDASPFTTLATTAFSSKTGSYGRVIASVTVPADPGRSARIGFKYRLQNQNAVGPILAYGARALNLDATSGISVHGLDGRGGQSFYDLAYQAKNVFTDAQLIAYFEVIRSYQIEMGWKPIVVLSLNSGHNDRNESAQPSLGWRASTTADSPAAYIDNVETLIKRYRDVWKMAGWDEDELYFLVMTSHPPSTGRDSQLDGYAQITEPMLAGQARCSYVEIQNLVTAAEIGDVTDSGVHLTNAGYDLVAERVCALVPGFSE